MCHKYIYQKSPDRLAENRHQIITFWLIYGVVYVARAIRENQKQKLTVLIVDDELPARRKMRSLLGKEHKVGSIAEAANGVEAVKCIHEKKPDLVFLDIQMPGKTCFEVIEAVGVESMPPIVFVTAYDRYAIEAFEVQAVDYLLKPYDQDRFGKSFKRALDRVAFQNENTIAIQQAIDRIYQGKNFLERIMLNIGQRYLFIKVTEIVYVSAEEKSLIIGYRQEIH